MKIETRVKLFFFIFSLIGSSLIGSIALYYIHESIELFANSPNKELAAIMADRLFFKFICGFAGTTVLISIISIICGTLLFNRISRAFLKSVSDLTGLAEQRLGSGRSETEILNNYLELLREDESRIHNLEKVHAWKDGARLLVHEIKNPLTPLKLSLQELSMTSSSSDDIEEVDSALTSVGDIEHILGTFKELVNIEFDTPELLKFTPLLTSLKQQFQKNYPSLRITTAIFSEEFHVRSVDHLIKMVVINLVNNGLEENSTGVELDITEEKSVVRFTIHTRDVKIRDIESIFNFGVSGKGGDRGYGLYLCNMISDYLSLDLTANNYDSGVQFTFNIKKVFDE